MPNYKPNKNIFKDIDEKRLRSPVSNKLRNKITRRLKNLPKNTFKKRILPRSKYYWQGVNNSLPPCAIDLPIIEMDTDPVNYHKFTWRTDNYPDWYVVEESCIIVDKNPSDDGRQRILAIFIYTKDDPNISKCLENSFRLVKKIDKYQKKKNKIFYSGFDTKLVEGESVKLDRKAGYSGINWLEGMQRYLDPSLGHQIIAYYSRKKEGDRDNQYLEDLIWLYCSLYELEKRHCPSIAKFRYDSAKKANFPGCFPGIPIEFNPSTCMGASIDFSSQTHNDSSMVGTVEAIIWRPDKTNPNTYMFTNSLISKYFYIKDDCMIYQVGTDPHGTLNTGNHGGVGFVNLSKKNLLCTTPYIQKWYKLWDNYLHKKN